MFDNGFLVVADVPVILDSPVRLALAAPLQPTHEKTAACCTRYGKRHRWRETLRMKSGQRGVIDLQWQLRPGQRREHTKLNGLR